MQGKLLSCISKIKKYKYRWTEGILTNQHLATVGLEYFIKEEKINGNIIQVKIWDTAGQERYKSLTKNYFRNSDGVIIIYDVSDDYSFEKVHDWIQSIFEYNDSDKNIKLVLVGNKIDREKRISTEQGKNLANLYGIPFFESSAKNNIGINEFMRKIIEDIYLSLNSVKKGVQLNNNDIYRKNYLKNYDIGQEGCNC